MPVHSVRSLTARKDEVTLIKISLPQEGCYYLKLDSFLLGPFNPSQNYDGSLPPFRAETDNISESRGNYHENNVEHSKTEGTFDYVPIMSELVSLASLSMPNEIQWRYKDAFGNLRTDSFALGFAYTGHTARISGQYYYVTSSSPDSISYYYFNSMAYNGIGPVSPSALQIVYSRTLTYVSGSNTRFYRVSEKQRSVYPAKLMTNYAELQDNGALLVKMWEAGTAERVTRSDGTEAQSNLLRSLNSINHASSQAITKVTALLSTPLPENILWPEEVHYGLLAQEASAKVNRNDTNMIAFLKDLRRPKDLIPKLRNLKSLRTHSGNYLGMQYGILPTISDLQEIIGAFKRVLPFFDSNGFTVYTANRSTSTSSGEIQIELEQRLKMAIDREDSEFRQFAQSINSAGFALTLENIWDLIPYSFMIDWFVKIGDFLERCDSRMRLMYLNIRYVTLSRKKKIIRSVKPTSSFPYFGTFTQVEYSRWTQDHCPLPPLFFQNTNTVSNHWLEAGALIIQRSKLK